MKPPHRLFIIIFIVYLKITPQHAYKIVGPYIVLNAYNDPSGTYKKSYYIPLVLRASWMGSYSLCKAVDLELLTFESQDELNTFMENLKLQKEDINYEMGFIPFEAYYGAYALRPGKKDGFVWYKTGEEVYDKLTLPWNNKEPNNYANIEWCGTIAQPDSNRRIVGMNDFKCFDTSFGRGMICQKMTSLKKSKGYNKMKS